MVAAVGSASRRRLIRLSTQRADTKAMVSNPAANARPKRVLRRRSLANVQAAARSMTPSDG